MNRKGSIFDWILIPVILLAASIFFFVISTMSNAINTNFQTSDLGSEGKALVQKGADAVSSQGIWFLFIAIGLLIGAVVSAYLIPSSPIFFPIMIIFIALSIFLSGAFANVYESFSSNESMSTALSQLEYINEIMTALPTFTMFGSILTAIVTYAFRRKGVGLY